MNEPPVQGDAKVPMKTGGVVAGLMRYLGWVLFIGAMTYIIGDRYFDKPEQKRLEQIAAEQAAYTRLKAEFKKHEPPAWFKKLRLKGKKRAYWIRTVKNCDGQPIKIESQLSTSMRGRR